MGAGPCCFSSQNLPLNPKSIDYSIEIGSRVLRAALNSVRLKRGEIWCDFEYCSQEILNGNIFLNDWLRKFNALLIDLFPANNPGV
jgi:hypothetical protein